jgi:hypothetical protein
VLSTLSHIEYDDPIFILDCTMSQPRQHHFVQAEHIRQFAGNDGTVWVYSIDGREFPVTPGAIFKRRDLNSYETPEGLDTQFETMITAVENETFPAISRTIQIGRIASEDVISITAYVALSRIRNPQVQAGIIEHRRQHTKTSIRLMDQNGKFDEIGPMPGYPGKTITDLIADGVIDLEINNVVYLESLASMVKTTHRALHLGFGWCLVKSPRRRVILSDHPMTIVHPGKDFGSYGVPLGGGGCEIGFPLSKDYYLLGLWRRQIDDFISEDAVDELNKRQAIFASRHIATYERRKQWMSLVQRFKHFGYQTVANTFDMPNEAMQVMRTGVFRMEESRGFKGSHPLLKTRSVISSKQRRTAKTILPPA